MRIAWIVVVVAVGSGTPALADETNPHEVVISTDCLRFWLGASWESQLSFAACIQDDTVDRIDRPDRLPGFVEQLHARLGPSLQFYEGALEHGPAPIQLRAAYYIGLGQVALITRARASLATPALQPELEPLLAPHARLAYAAFAAIDRSAPEDLSQIPDIVGRNMVRSARELAASLSKGWSFTVEDAPPFATPHAD